MLISGKAAEVIHVSGGFIYAGDISHVDSCLVLMVGFWRCSSLLLHGAIKCLRRLNGAFFFFLLKKILLTFFSFQLWGTDASSGELCPFHSDVSKGNSHPLWDQAFQYFLLAAFEMTEIEAWSLYLGQKFAWVTVRFSWDQNLSRREQRLNAMYCSPFPRLPEPVLICPMPQITDPILLTALLSKKTPSGPRKFPCCVTVDESARSWACMMLEIQVCAAEGWSCVRADEILNSCGFSGLFFNCKPMFLGVRVVFKMYSEEMTRPWDSSLWLNVTEIGFASARRHSVKTEWACEGLEKNWASVLYLGVPGK